MQLGLRIFLILLFFQPFLLNAQQNLEKWKPGWMDIHHISTGRGNATFMVFPDGTTLLFDAGEISETHPRTKSIRNSEQKPNNSKKAHEWIAAYIKRNSPLIESPKLDYAVISHFHDDHFGEWDSTLPYSVFGKYRKTGITGIAEYIPIKNLIDRGHRFPIDLQSLVFQEQYKNDEYHLVATLNNYFTFIESLSKKGLVYDSLVVGANDQIKLLNNPERYKNWQCINICGAGKIATGYSNRQSYSIIKEGLYPGENPLSIGIKIQYGKFDYFTGGDMSGINNLGMTDDKSLESQAAPIIGAVDVATLNHHGNRDAESPFFVRTIRPRVWIQQTWSSDHPGQDVLRRIMSTDLYPGERSLFATDLLQPNIDVIGEKSISQTYSSTNGHILVRVFNGGNEYSIYVLDHDSLQNSVIKTVGPLTSR